ncbi:ATP-dependent RNA helicase DbpA [Vibrio sp. DNF-1]|nr:ATP-dependent RNA helicase DbpA [Vibrio salinus]MCE0492497.1 ATP-dependent RNA helicase DbpA [Vibrio salinus]
MKSNTEFCALKLNPLLVRTLSELGFNKMTPIQKEALPLILDGKDILAQAKTGSGKTAAFGLGILDHLDVKRFRVQSLILCPTRELADQVAKELRRFARGIHNIKILTLCGGVAIGPQIGSLEHGAHIIVGTPGRILDHLNKGRLNLDNVKQFVLDEADRMLEMGFTDALDDINRFMPSVKQTLLFSATFPESVAQIARDSMNNPVSVKIEDQQNSLSIEQTFYSVTDSETRQTAVKTLLLQEQPESAVVFCNTKRETQEMADYLEVVGFNVKALHGDLDQRQRDQALALFSLKCITILVATDVAARGLDIDSLDLVVNYQLAHDPDTHIHRIGRTGRAGEKGAALSLVGPKDETKLALLEERIGIQTLCPIPKDNLPNHSVCQASMSCIRIEAGKKQKLRPGDILGALTAGKDISGKNVGKIQIHDIWAYVAVERALAKLALEKINNGKMKGKSFHARIMS